jgi:long-chain acyl-CoA synthetase
MTTTHTMTATAHDRFAPDAALTPLVRRFFQRAVDTPDAMAFAVYPRGASTPAATLTWGAWSRLVRAAAAQLFAAGIERGDRVVVLAGNRAIWPVADLAIQAVGAVGVGVYPSSTDAQLDALLQDSGARWLFTDDVAQAARVAVAGVHAPALVGIVLDARDDTVSRPAGVHAFDAWCADGEARLAQDAALGAQLDARVSAVTADDLAALIYTSGSTGVPKGAGISHRYLAASAQSIAEVLELTAADRSLSFLPYSHAAERIFGQCTRILTGMASALIEDPADLFTVAAHFRPTLFGALPRIFERLYEAADVARQHGGSARDAITARIGDAVRIATSGGAALPVTIAETLDTLGLRILGAYGQTEHLCVAMNRPAAPRFDTVGLPMPGTEVRVADDGELLVRRSALTFSGYWQRDDETRAAFTDDGTWLHTGDRAVVLEDGSLRITGRVKELIALSTGRKIAPLPIEAALTATPYIAHAVCHGEGRKFLVALLSPRRAMLEAWAASQGESTPWPALASQPSVRALLETHVSAVNATLARTDRIVAFAITADEFTQENGLLTPTFKVVRRAADARYAGAFASLYARVEAAS